MTPPTLAQEVTRLAPCGDLAIFGMHDKNRLQWKLVG